MSLQDDLDETKATARVRVADLYSVLDHYWTEERRSHSEYPRRPHVFTRLRALRDSLPADLRDDLRD
jgi:hypothetical protein